jgi:hypothetical protein
VDPGFGDRALKRKRSDYVFTYGLVRLMFRFLFLFIGLFGIDLFVLIVVTLVLEMLIVDIAIIVSEAVKAIVLTARLVVILADHVFVLMARLVVILADHVFVVMARLVVILANHVFVLMARLVVIGLTVVVTNNIVITWDIVVAARDLGSLKYGAVKVAKAGSAVQNLHRDIELVETFSTGHRGKQRETCQCKTGRK